MRPDRALIQILYPPTSMQNGEKTKLLNTTAPATSPQCSLTVLFPFFRLCILHTIIDVYD